MPDAGESLRRCAAAARAALDAGGWPAPGTRTLIRAPQNTAPRPPRRWRTAGHPHARMNGRALVTGAHHFPTDVTRPDMLHGAILHPPVYGAQLSAVGLQRVRELADAVVHEDGMVAVAAHSAHAARQALEALNAGWTEPETVEEHDLERHLRTHPVEIRGWGGAVHECHGDPERAFREAALVSDTTYRTAYIAHACLEPRVAVAEWDDGRLTVWTGAQQPFMVRRELADGLGIPERDVRVIVPDLGGGFGSKHTEEIALAAARLARAAGRPVRIAHTRQEEFRFSYLRPAAVIDISSGALPGRDDHRLASSERQLGRGRPRLPV